MRIQLLVQTVNNRAGGRQIPNRRDPPNLIRYHRAVLRAILFDFNGVLVDDEPIHFELLQRVLREEGLDLSREDYDRDYLGKTDHACFELALRKANQEPREDLLSRLVARKGAYYMMRMRLEGYPIFDGARDLVEAASEAGLMLGVVSGALRAEVEGALAQLGLEDHFKALVTAEDVSRGKPDPEGFRRGLALLNATPPLPQRLLHPHEVLAIEDSPHGLEAARQTGLATLGVAHSHAPETLDLADRVVESLVDLDLSRLRVLFAETV